MNNLGKEMLQLRNNPNVRAMLDWITRAEHGRISPENYSRAFGNTKISLDNHPNRMFTVRNKNGKTTAASAAGAYQINMDTWKDMAKLLGLTNFGKDSQDAATIALMKQRGVLNDVLNGNMATAIQKMADKNVWASMPTHKQATTTWSQAKKHFADYGIKVNDVFPEDTKRLSQSMNKAKQDAPIVNELFARQLLSDNAAALAADEGFTIPSLSPNAAATQPVVPLPIDDPQINQGVAPLSKSQSLVEAFADLLPNTTPFLDQSSLDQFVAESQMQADDARNASVTSFINGGKQAPATMAMPAPLRREIDRIIANLQD